MNHREISFSTYDEVTAEIERLEAVGYERLGEWSLGQICRHLSYYMRGSLDGFGFKLPWLVRRFIGRPILKRMLRTGKMKRGERTAPDSIPNPEHDDRDAAAEAKELLAKLRDFSGELYASPIFDRLTTDQWRELHLMHAANHLGFLIPHDADG